MHGNGFYFNSGNADGNAEKMSMQAESLAKNEAPSEAYKAVSSKLSEDKSTLEDTYMHCTISL